MYSDSAGNDFMLCNQLFRSLCALSKLPLVRLFERCRVSRVEQPLCRSHTIWCSRLHDSNSAQDVIVIQTSERWAQWSALHPYCVIDTGIKRDQQVASVIESYQTDSTLAFTYVLWHVSSKTSIWVSQYNMFYIYILCLFSFKSTVSNFSLVPYLKRKIL